MRQPLSQQFVFSFLSACYDAGLSKEAAAELLQKEATDQELRRRPAFAEGFLSTAQQIPGQLLPLRAGYECLEKSAWAPGPVLSGLGRAGKALFWDLPKGLGGAVKGTFSNTATGVKKVRDSSFLKNHPFAALVGGSTATGAAALGVDHWLNRDSHLQPYRPAPFFSPSGYSPEAYKDRYKRELESHTPGIYEHNKDFFGTEKRRKELTQAVAEGKGGDAAYLELQDLNRQHAATNKKRTRHMDSLEGYQASNNQLVDQIADRIGDLENQRTAWWAAPKRLWLRATGQKPQDYFDERISSLQANRTQAQMEADLAADRQRLLWAGATEAQEKKPPTSQELQQRFFSSY